MANDSKNVDEGNNLMEIRGDYEHESNLFHEIVEGIKDSLEIQISKSLFARGEKNIDLGLARSYCHYQDTVYELSKKERVYFQFVQSPRRIPNSSEKHHILLEKLTLTQWRLYRHILTSFDFHNSHFLPIPHEPNQKMNPGFCPCLFTS